MTRADCKRPRRTITRAVVTLAYWRFRFLPVFRRTRWRNVELLFSSIAGRRPSVGLADRIAQGRYNIVIDLDRQDGLDDALSTLLHEMAHVAVWASHIAHGRMWARTYSEAARQATGVAVKTHRDVRKLDLSVVDAMSSLIDRWQWQVFAAAAWLVVVLL